MFAVILSTTLAIVFKVSIALVLLTAIIVWAAQRYRLPFLIKTSKFLRSFILGVFGVFRCHCTDIKDTRKPGFCWLWMELENCISTLMAIAVGAIIMSLTLSLIPLMMVGGVTSFGTLATPVALYLVYPITLYAVRRDNK